MSLVLRLCKVFEIPLRQQTIMHDAHELQDHHKHISQQVIGWFYEKSK